MPVPDNDDVAGCDFDDIEAHHNDDEYDGPADDFDERVARYVEHINDAVRMQQRLRDDPGDTGGPADTPGGGHPARRGIDAYNKFWDDQRRAGGDGDTGG